MAAKVTFHSRCAWCGQPKIANVHPTHGTSIACVEALKAELRRAEEAGIDAIRAVAVQLAEVTAERDRLAAEVAGADEAVDLLVGQYREMRAERDRLAARLERATAALEHYADPATFCPFTGYYLPKGWDGCKVARAALAAAREAGSVSTGAGGGPEACASILEAKGGQSAMEGPGR